MGFYEDIEKGLLEAIAIEKGEIPLVRKNNMPSDTFVVAELENEIIDQFIKIRKTENISQSQLAEMVGSKQQTISRIENKEHSPSLKLFYSIVNAMGYELKIVKK